MNVEGVLAWTVLGLAGGWMAGHVMRDGSQGVVGALFAGLIGALIGGFLVSLALPGPLGAVGSAVAALLGAILLVGILRAVSSSRELA